MGLRYFGLALPVDSAIRRGQRGEADGRSFTLLGNKAIRKGERDTTRR